MTLNFHLCIHNHFYQPPRENPWLETIEYQESAAPFHDWNERISAESYRPNGLSRILDDEGWVVRLTNNYARTSFNFGPTLLSWMEHHDPSAYQAILDGDKESLRRFDGHGSAIAQAYNHIILPLATRRDKETQVRWGLRDFEMRFGREAEAMWLPETAADIETLEVLADHGMKFVILAPRQAQWHRPLGVDTAYTDASGEQIDPKRPYTIALPGGKSIAAFFYDGPISKSVAFEGLLHNGETFAHRLMQGFDRSYEGDQLLHIATDGESYGHHHRHGDMALAYALDYIEKNGMAQLTNYGLYLEQFPPVQEAVIFEQSSWSCAHGVERWRSDCGCNSGMKPDWHQKWRAPLREAFDALRDRLEKPYEDFMAAYTDDPWGMRDDYIYLILDRSAETRARFLEKWLKAPLSPEDHLTEQKILKALETQRNLLLMYTSCAWFFDEVSGIETVQNLQYAARAIELARDLFGISCAKNFMDVLEKAPSNIEALKNGREVYIRHAQSARVDFIRIVAHLAVKSLFHERQQEGSLYCFDYKWIEFSRKIAGKLQLICGAVVLHSQITQESHKIEFCILHFGDHNLNVGVRPYLSGETFHVMADAFLQTFGRGDLTQSVRLLDHYFEGHLFSLGDLFRDVQKEVIDIVFSQTLDGVETQFSHVYEQHYPVMCYLSDIHMALPPVFSHIAHFVQNNRIVKEFQKDDFRAEEIARYVEEAKSWGVSLDGATIQDEYLAALKRVFRAYKRDPLDMVALGRFVDLLDVMHVFPFKFDLGRIQNSFTLWMHNVDVGPLANNAEWKELIRRITLNLKIRMTAEDFVLG